MERSPGPDTAGAGSPALKSGSERTSRPVGRENRRCYSVALAAQVHGYQTAFHISAAFSVVAALVAAFVLKQKGQESVAEAGATVGMAEG